MMNFHRAFILIMVLIFASNLCCFSEYQWISEKYDGKLSAGIDFFHISWNVTKEDMQRQLMGIEYEYHSDGQNFNCIEFLSDYYGKKYEVQMNFSSTGVLKEISVKNYFFDDASIIDLTALLVSNFGMPNTIKDPECEYLTDYNSYYVWQYATWEPEGGTIYELVNENEVYFEIEEDTLFSGGTIFYPNILIYPKENID